jgi:glycosyltransferase involved in cell wall biosynthesis
LYTDFWAGPVTRRLARSTGSTVIRSLATRFNADLEDAPVTSWNTCALWWEWTLRGRRKTDAVRGPYHGFADVGRRFGSRIRDHLESRTDLDSRAIFFAYDTGALEALEWCRERGVPSILNQMDPNRIEMELVHAEEKCWPGWALQSVSVPEEYLRRRENEWALANRILVNSNFCREALIKQGVSSEKLVVVPLCYELAGGNQKSGIDRAKLLGQNGPPKRPLRVLFLGQVILRKGIQYLMQAAKLLEKEGILFDVVGPLGITSEAAKTAPRNLVFHGRASRDQTNAWYQQSDVFVLPTLSDGFAITQIEAMANGLPVIATPHCGQVVGNGVDGFIVPARDASALAAACLRYVSEPGLLESQSAAALQKAGQFSLGHLADNLKRLEAGMLKGNGS